MQPAGELGVMPALGASTGLPVLTAPALGTARAGSGRTTAEVACPRSMVGRVIGKNGETIKALQAYTGALIQIDQSTDPTRVTISGTTQSLQLAMSMVTDICKGTFKGFALLRQLIQPQRPGGSGLPGTPAQPRPVYAPGYGLIPPSQLYGPDDQSVLQATPMNVIGAMPQTTVLQPGFQYVQTTPMGDTQVVLGLPPGVQAVQQDGQALLQALPMQQAMPLQQVQQVPLQQVYNVPAGFGAPGLTMYQPVDYSGTDGLGITDQFSLQPTAQFANLQGSNAAKVLGAAGMHNHVRGQQMRPGPAGMKQLGNSAAASGPGSSSSWVDSSKMDNNTMGQVAMNELLGGGGSQGGAGGVSLSNLGSQQQLASNQLLRVIGPEGNVQYYLQGSGEAPGQNMR